MWNFQLLLCYLKIKVCTGPPSEDWTQILLIIANQFLTITPCVYVCVFTNMLQLKRCNIFLPEKIYIKRNGKCLLYIFFFFHLRTCVHGRKCLRGTDVHEALIWSNKFITHRCWQAQLWWTNNDDGGWASAHHFDIIFSFLFFFFPLHPTLLTPQLVPCPPLAHNLIIQSHYAVYSERTRDMLDLISLKFLSVAELLKWLFIQLTRQINLSTPRNCR